MKTWSRQRYHTSQTGNRRPPTSAAAALLTSAARPTAHTWKGITLHSPRRFPVCVRFWGFLLTPPHPHTDDDVMTGSASEEVERQRVDCYLSWSATPGKQATQMFYWIDVTLLGQSIHVQLHSLTHRHTHTHIAVENSNNIYKYLHKFACLLWQHLLIVEHIFKHLITYQGIL